MGRQQRFGGPAPGLHPWPRLGFDQLVLFANAEVRALAECHLQGACATNNSPTIAVGAEFFKFLASRESSAQQGLSVARGEEFQAPASGKLFLEDPVEWQKTGQHKNLLEGLGETQWARTLEEAKKVSEGLTASAARSRWFHWSEVFDPRDVPPIKMQRMPSMT